MSDPIGYNGSYVEEPRRDLSKCPGCGGPADNGHDRSYPDPSPFFCTKCDEKERAGLPPVSLAERAATLRAEQTYREWLNNNGGPNQKHTNPKDILGSGRVPMELSPDTLRVATAMAFLEGAMKYGRYNWRCAGVRASIYYAALERHMAAWWGGEEIDPDSGLPHLWKAAACLAVLIDAEQVGKLTDDRPPRAPVAEMLKGLLPKVEELQQRYADRQPYQYTIADTPAQGDEMPFADYCDGAEVLHATEIDPDDLPF